MSTTMANAKTVSRKWYVLDAADVPLGRLAAKAAVLLRGKHKPDFTPKRRLRRSCYHCQCGKSGSDR